MEKKQQDGILKCKYLQPNVNDFNIAIKENFQNEFKKYLSTLNKKYVRIQKV